MSGTTLHPKTQKVLEALRRNAEGEFRGWQDVYLDNARPAGMSARAFAGHLSILERAGLYRPIDGSTWGSVRAGEA